MKPLFTILLAGALGLAACDSKQTPTKVDAADEQPTTREPVAPALTLGSDAFEGVDVFAILPRFADFVFGTSNPTAFAAELGIEPTSEGSGIASGPPELGDLHPEAMKRLGLDPEAPAGFVRYRDGFADDTEFETSGWALYAKVADATKLEEVYGALEPVPMPEDADADAGARPQKVKPAKMVRNIGGPGRPVARTIADGEWVLLSPESVPLADTPKSSLASDEEFQKRRAALKYGSLATIYVPGRDSQIVGLGAEKDGLGLRTLNAQTDAVGPLAELAVRIGGARLAMQRSYGMLGLLGGTNEEIKKLEKELDEERWAPRRRQAEALVGGVQASLANAEQVDLGDDVTSLLIKSETSPLESTASAWLAAAMTPEEAKAIAEKEKEIERLRRKERDKMFGSMFKDIGEMKTLGSMGIGKDVTFESQGFGQIGAKGEFGGGGLVGSKGSAGIGTLGTGRGGGGTGYGTIGGLGGTRGKSRTVVLESADTDIKQHASRKLGRIRSCHTADAPKAPFQVTAAIDVDADGRATVSSISGGNPAVQSCVKRALGGAAATKGVGGKVVLNFVEK